MAAAANHNGARRAPYVLTVLTTVHYSMFPPEDPVLTSSRREALVVLAVWVVATAYSVGYCALAGYDRDPASLSFVLWFPDWVFWGIVAPWFVCIAISLWFALAFMRDEDLGSSADEDADGDGQADGPRAPEPGHE